jgi:hypothetical protein
LTLTTQDGTKLGQNVVADANANVAIDAPAPRTISPDAAILFDKSIVARPLGVPQVCEIRIKNLEYRYRWVNRDGLGGRIYTQRRAQGFMNATPDDVEVMSADSEAKDGEIRAGDVVLMKIRKDLYDGAMKANMVKAQVLSRARGLYQEGGSSDVNSNEVANRKTISADPGARTGQAPAFIPENVDRMIDDSIKSGRAEETRAAVDELRTSAKGSK